MSTPYSRPSPRQLEVMILQQTLQLEHDTWHLYDGASRRLGDPDEAEAVADFAGDHHQHLIALRTRLALLGANVSVAGAGTRLRGVGQRLWHLMGAEPALLGALARQERLMHDHYGSVDMNSLSRASRALMHHALCDERGHHRWLEDRVARLRRGSVAPLSAAVASRAAVCHWGHARL